MLTILNLAIINSYHMYILCSHWNWGRLNYSKHNKAFEIYQDKVDASVFV